MHSTGGVLLEHLKAIGLGLDLSARDTFFWSTSPSWMVWNYLVSGLLVGARIVCFDGSPTHPSLDAAPRHLPDDIIEVAAVPHTLTGKKLEIPIKRILLGQRPENVVDLEAVDRPDVLIDLAALAPAASRS